MSIKVVIRRIAIKVGIKGVRVKIPDRSEVTQTTFLRANEIRFTLILRITIRIEKEILEAFEEHLDFEIEPFSNCLCRLPGAYSSLISYRLSCKIKRKKKKKRKKPTSYGFCIRFPIGPRYVRGKFTPGIQCNPLRALFSK